MIGHCMLRNTTLCTDSHHIRNDYSNVMNYSDDDDSGNSAVMSATQQVRDTTKRVMRDTTWCGLHAAVVGTSDNICVSELTRRCLNKRPQKQQRRQNVVVETICVRQKSRPSTLLRGGKCKEMTQFRKYGKKKLTKCDAICVEQRNVLKK